MAMSHGFAPKPVARSGVGRQTNNSSTPLGNWPHVVHPRLTFHNLIPLGLF
ncbi:Uu.00g140970.m01.CDS01 [Anthostomella pinea]|uniref:Uu.00g140970.m01.CDS01 n=1 Tax=Anthostomella pinea TaxID=933095 RepID=A0AAI8VQ51_9PEZI|nr:Uu.00g140970.m01.CDS01 [Anthostomella pinea]